METLILKASDQRVGSREPEEVKWPDVDINKQAYRKEVASTLDLGGGYFVVFSRQSPLPEGGVKLEGASPAPAGVPKSDDSPKSFGRSTPLPVKEDSEAKGV